MIRSKKELRFYIAADRIMNGRPAKRTVLEVLSGHTLPGGALFSYLRAMRMCAYYSNESIKHFPLSRIKYYYWLYIFRVRGLKLGFSIGYNTLGYGVCIPHYGTIVIGESNRIGNYAVLHTSTCISNNGKEIGDALYLSTGVKITSKIKLGNGISIGANSLVNKSFEGDNLLLGGMPAKLISKTVPWYVRDGFLEKVHKVEALKHSFGV